MYNKYCYDRSSDHQIRNLVNRLLYSQNLWPIIISHHQLTLQVCIRYTYIHVIIL